MSFGEILREIRMKNGDSLRKLAEKTDIVFTYIDRLEKGTVPINKNLLEKFIKAYPLYKKQFEKAYLDEIMPETLKGSTFNMEEQKVNTVILPVYGKASAGNGYINLDQEIYYFPINYLHPDLFSLHVHTVPQMLFQVHMSESIRNFRQTSVHPVRYRACH